MIILISAGVVQDYKLDGPEVTLKISYIFSQEEMV